MQDGFEEEHRWVEANAPICSPARFDDALREANEALDRAERDATPAFISLDDETAEMRLRRRRAPRA